MSMYVIVKVGSHPVQFCAPLGQERSYTKDLTKARTFRSLDAATRECCGNELAVHVTEMLLGPEG